jgi:hypothetical protein
MELQVDVGHVESCFGPFGDIVSVGTSFDEDIIGSKMTMPTTSIPKVQPFYMRLIFDAFDELMLHHDMCSFSFSELLTWIKGMFDCIWKAWKVNEVDWGPNPSIPNVHH